MTSYFSCISNTTATSTSTSPCIFDFLMAVTHAGHGEVRLSNVLPLMSGKGLDPELDLYVLDNQKIREGETVRLEISIPNTRERNRSKNNRRNNNKTNEKNKNQKKENDIDQRTFSRSKKSAPEADVNGVFDMPNTSQSEAESGKVHDLDSSRVHHTNQSNRFDIPFRPLKPIKITLCWYDPPAPLGSSRSLLMHDLDLVVIAPDGAMHWGNANSGEDNHSSGDSKKGQQRRAGDPPGSNSSFPGWAWADDTNPNEQVYITNPHCEVDSLEDECYYTVYVHAGLLPAHVYQTFAIIITSPGEVSEPITSDRWFDDLVPYGTNHPPVPPIIPNYVAAEVNIKGGLAGGELVSTTKFIDVCDCTTLQILSASLIFKQGQSSYTSPNNLELTIGESNNSSIFSLICY